MAEYIEREGAYPLAKKICDAIDSDEFQRLNFGMRILDWIDDIPAADVVSHEWVIEHMSGDYISREKAIENVLDQMKHSTSENAMRERLLNLVAADVRPVVLCRDCKHSDTFAPDCTEATFPLKCLSIRYGGVYPNWFCEHGEKREES